MNRRSISKKVKASLVLAAIVVTLLPPSSPAVAAGETISAIASNASYHARRTFGTGMYDATANKTFINYSGPKMDVYVKAYNHATNVWEPSIKVYTWNKSSTGAYHDYGTMTLLPDGKLGIFIFHHTATAYLIKAPTAHSLSGTWTRTTINTDKNTYPMPVVMGGTVYLFYSKNDNESWPYRTYRYTKSTNSGASWSAPTTIIDSGQTADKFNEVYAWGVHPRDGKIYITWTMAGGPGGHNNQSRNLYLAYFNTSNGNMHNASGSDLGPVVDNADLNACLVRASLPGASNPYPIEKPVPNVSDNGTPVVLFGETTSGGSKSILFGRLQSGAWSFKTAESGTARAKDIVKSGSSFEVLYVTADDKRLRSKTTANLGDTWSTNYDLAVPYAPSNANFTMYANFIEGRKNIRVVGGTINFGERTTDYTGKWPIFAVKQ